MAINVTGLGSRKAEGAIKIMLELKPQLEDKYGIQEVGRTHEVKDNESIYSFLKCLLTSLPWGQVLLQTVNIQQWILMGLPPKRGIGPICTINEYQYMLFNAERYEE